MSFMFGATFLVHLLISKKPVESLEVEQKFSKSVSQKNRITLILCWSSEDCTTGISVKWKRQQFRVKSSFFTEIE